LKTRADLLIDGVYKRITIWDALDWKINRPELWEVYKDCLFSINKNPEYKVKMIFQMGRNGNLKKSYFRYKVADFEHRGEGSEESYRHEFFKECISRIKRLELRWLGESLTIYPDEILQEETIIMKDGSRRIADLLVNFSKAEPNYYVEKWEGKLAIEIYDTHKVDEGKAKQMKENGIAVFEFNVSNWYIKDEFQDKYDEEKQIVDKVNKLSGENGGYIRGTLRADPTSRKYFSTLLYEEERKKHENTQAQLKQLQCMYKEVLNRNNELGKYIETLKNNNVTYENRISYLSGRLQDIEDENKEIKQTGWYRLFGKKRLGHKDE